MTQRTVIAAVIAAAMLVLGVPLAFAAGQTADQGSSAPAEMAEPMGKYRESPMLAAMVAAGELPPVDERLPVNPFVRQVEEEIGEYSGTMRIVSQHQFGYGTFFRQGEMPGLFQIPMSLDEHVAKGGPIQGFEPKYAEYYTWLDDGSTVEVKIRDGAKWSDGHPLTAEDIVWPFENMYTNPGYSARMTNLQSTYKGERFVVTQGGRSDGALPLAGGSLGGPAPRDLGGLSAAGALPGAAPSRLRRGQDLGGLPRRPLTPQHPGDSVAAGLDPRRDR